MGYYINEIDEKLPPSNGKGKVKFILDNIPGSKIIDTPKEWKEDIVCVVENSRFDAAAYAYSPEELNVFKTPDGRRKTWMIVPDAKTHAK